MAKPKVDPKISEAAKLIAPLGGAARKAQNPDYKALSKKGLEKRWGKKESE